MSHSPAAQLVSAGHRVGAPDDPDDQVAALQPAVWAGVDDPAERFMAQDQSIPTRAPSRTPRT